MANNKIPNEVKIDQKIFKEYDVRGVYPKEIDEKAVYKIAQKFAKFLNLGEKSRVIVGRDGRESSPSLASSFIEGLLDLEIDVIDIGAVKTPMLYFAVPYLGANGGAMVTASHLGEDQNGIKFTRGDASPVGGKEIKDSVLETSNTEAPTAEGKTSSIVRGTLENINIEKPYLEKVFDSFDPEAKKIKVNASFDADFDRLMVNNKDGKKIRGDIIGAIIAEKIVKEGDCIIYDLRCSHRVIKHLKSKGFLLTPSSVGHFNVKKLMREKDSIFGMELSGHYYFRNFNFAESSSYALRLLKERIYESGLSLEELVKPFEQDFHSDIIRLGSENMAKTIEKVKEKFKNGKQNEMDGLTVEYQNFWFNIRQSHTEPVLKLVVEAETKELMDEKIKEITKLLLN